ncbi:hypothetical protein ERUR111494_00135 [Erysipelothrix urinaevulpis]|uniref:hypothetical protein n=1 Tax=Erysipelothrix urinaevulpis TaxID=2683717 RepID=UPI0013578FE2|nr:hypothetical protein [Erysipelothrix urinaevulpis]
MYKELKNNLMNRNISFVSDLDVMLDYDDMIKNLEGVQRLVFDEVSIEYRDLNKRFVDCAVEVGVEHIVVLEAFNQDDVELTELSELKKYLKMYPDTKQSFIRLPMFMEMLYQTMIDEYELSKKDFTVMSKKNVNEVLTAWLSQETLALNLELKGIAYDSIESYYRVFDGQKPSHKKYPIKNCDIEIMTWHEFVQSKKN